MRSRTTLKEDHEILRQREHHNHRDERANGPWIAARVINDEGFDNVLWLGIALFAASLVLIMIPLREHHRA